MTPHDAARATAQAIGDLGGGFMLDGATYAKGAELGFGGLDFYVLGRGGVLGDTSADVVAAGFVFWNPSTVAAQWAAGRAVMAPAEAAGHWATVCHAYAEANLPDVDGLADLADLAARVVDAASPAGASVFAGWRGLPVPAADRPKARVLHLVNALRELRAGLHGGAVLAAGLTPLDAVAYRSPGMAGIFGWDPEQLPDAASVKERWTLAEDGTDTAVARVLSVLDGTDLDRFTTTLTALHRAWRDR